MRCPSTYRLPETILRDIQQALEDIQWLSAMWLHSPDNGKWEDTVVLIAVANTRTFAEPRLVLYRRLAPIENRHGIVFDVLMYSPSNVPHTDEHTQFIIRRDGFVENQGTGYSFADDDPVNQRKIDRAAAFADILEKDPSVIQEVHERFEFQQQGAYYLANDEWGILLEEYSIPMLCKLLRSKNRRMQTLAVSNPIPPKYNDGFTYNIPPEKLERLTKIVLES